MRAAEIAAAVNAGKASATHFVEVSLNRIAAYDAVQPQAWIHRPNPETVRAQAAEVDARIAAGETLPLAGVPFAVKDNIDVAGMPTTAACPAFTYAAERSATVVDRLKAAGAVCMGKTNLDQFATGLVGTRSPFGICTSVLNEEHISGGSSSGSAVAVAAGLVPFALGTDTAGSGRVPAALNGLVGLKPTKGRWSTQGLVPACRSLDCISLFANDLADIALIEPVLAAFDAEDPYSRQTKDRALGRRIGVPRPDQLNWCGDEESPALFDAALKAIEGAGMEPVESDIGFLQDTAAMLYQGPWVAERTAALSDLLRDDPSALHPVVRAIVEQGLNVTAVDTFRAQYRLQTQIRRAAQMWDGIDALVLPTAPTSYRIADLLDDPITLNSNLGLYTNFVNLLDMSAIAVPAGFRKDRTGFGITLIGPAWADAALLKLAGDYLAAAEPALSSFPDRERA